MGFLAILSVGTVFTKAAAIVGANVPTTSGKETGTIDASWNVCETRKGIGKNHSQIS